MKIDHDVKREDGSPRAPELKTSVRELTYDFRTRRGKLYLCDYGVAQLSNVGPLFEEIDEDAQEVEVISNRCSDLLVRFTDEGVWLAKIRNWNFENFYGASLKAKSGELINLRIVDGIFALEDRFFAYVGGNPLELAARSTEEIDNDLARRA